MWMLNFDIGCVYLVAQSFHCVQLLLHIVIATFHTSYS